MRTHCSLCGHPTRRRRIVDRYFWREKYLVLITDVPADVCTFCGETYVHGEVANRCDEIAQPIIAAATVASRGPLAVVSYRGAVKSQNSVLAVREARREYRPRKRRAKRSIP